MGKIKKILAVTLVLAIGISVLTINSSANSAIARLADAIKIQMDIIEHGNDYTEIFNGLSQLHKENPNVKIKDIDLNKISDVITQVGTNNPNCDDLSKIIESIKNSGNKISVDAFVNILESVLSNKGLEINNEAFKTFIIMIGNSSTDNSEIKALLKTIIDNVDYGQYDKTINIDNLKEYFNIIIDVFKDIVDINIDDKEDSSTPICSNNDGWTGIWSTSMVKGTATLFEQDASVSLKDVTARNRVTATMSADTIRITLSNKYGTAPMVVNEVTAAKANKVLDRAIDLSTLVNVTFNGKKSVTIPAGMSVVSDPISLSIKALDDISISMYFERISSFKTVGLIGGHSYVSIGNTTHNYIVQPSINLALDNLSVGAYEILPVLSNIDAYTDKSDAYSVVLIGDSTLTNSIYSELAKDLNDNGYNNVGILLQAIKGNEVLHDGSGLIGNIMGQGILKTRFEMDALSQAGVKKIIFKAGLNDILHPNCASKKDGYIKLGVETNADGILDQTDNLIEAYKTIINEAHAAGIEIYFASNTPFKGYTRNLFGVTGDDITWSVELDALRVKINNWYQSSDCKADGYIDLDTKLADKTGCALQKEFTLDGVHFTPAGCKVAADIMFETIWGNKSQEDGNISNDNNNSQIKFSIILETISKMLNANIPDCDIIANIQAYLNSLNITCDCQIIDVVKGIISNKNFDTTEIVTILKAFLNGIGSYDIDFDYPLTKIDFDSIFKDLKVDVDCWNKLVEFFKNFKITLPDINITADTDLDDLVDKIFGKDTDTDAIPGKSDTDTNKPSNVVDPIIKPYVDETEEDIDFITDLVTGVEDNTPLDGLSNFNTDPSLESIADTGDNSVIGVEIIASFALVAFILIKKKY